MTRTGEVVGLRSAVEERLERLCFMLEDWAQWQQGYRMKLGYPTRSLSGGGCRAVETSYEDLYASVDNAMFEAIEAAVDDLPPAQRAAVCRRYGIAAVYRFPRDNYAEQLDLAHDALIRTLPRRGVDIA